MKYKKKELLKMLDTLVQANQAIGKADIRKLSMAGEAFEQCQTAAIEIGTYLETYGEATTVIVNMLEDYCENIYQQSIKTDAPDICRKISKKIQKQLSQIINAVRYELPEDKKEVIFLPYKASMWDSLESVWMAAREDVNCDAYVIPIPYFERNPDGSFGQMYYEGDEYPDYVPITDWQDYSIPEHRPDVIYIHNPYDDCNYVTSVHPMFYAKELKKYTDMLVYIPYFVGINDSVEEHFCVAPGTIYADRVIVESKEVRKIYIREFQKFEKENNCKGKFGNLEEKFLALGSPKFDRVRNIKRENIEIPEEWQRLIIKENGMRKKVILYNTTVASLLKFGEASLKKIENSLEIFRQNQGVVLLWRPHPLLLSTLSSMRPDLYQRLYRMTEDYKAEGWGIYDDTADIERAIALSDAYYGDWSSVVTLYQATGKPIMIREYEEENEKNV